jgi:hypothetical protein
MPLQPLPPLRARQTWWGPPPLLVRAQEARRTPAGPLGWGLPCRRCWSPLKVLGPHPRCWVALGTPRSEESGICGPAAPLAGVLVAHGLYVLALALAEALAVLGECILAAKAPTYCSRPFATLLPTSAYFLHAHCDAHDARPYAGCACCACGSACCDYVILTHGKRHWPPCLAPAPAAAVAAGRRRRLPAHRPLSAASSAPALQSAGADGAAGLPLLTSTTRCRLRADAVKPLPAAHARPASLTNFSHARGPGGLWSLSLRARMDLQV